MTVRLSALRGVVSQRKTGYQDQLFQKVNRTGLSALATIGNSGRRNARYMVLVVVVAAGVVSVSGITTFHDHTVHSRNIANIPDLCGCLVLLVAVNIR